MPPELSALQSLKPLTDCQLRHRSSSKPQAQSREGRGAFASENNNTGSVPILPTSIYLPQHKGESFQVF